jgi:hypothetical protein
LFVARNLFFRPEELGMPDLKVFADEDLAPSKLLFDVLAGETTNR